MKNGRPLPESDGQRPMVHGTFVIGLTGNIATGKSTVAGLLSGLGAFVIDADSLAHQVMRAGTVTNQRIVDEFGNEIRQADGQIDRAMLGERVFSDAASLARLEAIVHPAVVAEAERQIRDQMARGRRVVVLEAIKLIESGMRERCNELWAVTCPRDQQLERLIRTRSLTRAEAELRISAQPSQEDKIALADVVIDNGGSLEQTRSQVEREWSRIEGELALAAGESMSGGNEMPLRKWFETHPLATMWAILAIGMVTIFWFTSGDAGLRLTQRLFVSLVCVLLAGLCTWIIDWE